MSFTRLRERLWAPLAVVTVLLLPSALVAATIYFGTGSLWPEAARKSSPATVVVWGDRSFTTRRGFKMWLEANGGDYRRWSKLHPAAAELLSHPRRARRAVARSKSSPHVASAVPIERRAYFALIGLAGGLAAFVAISVVGRLPRVSIPAVALGVHGTTAGRLATATAPGIPGLRIPRPRGRVAIPRARVGSAAERGRSLLGPVRGLSSWSVSATATAFSVFRHLERFDLVLGAVSVAAGLSVGILVPFVLAR